MRLISLNWNYNKGEGSVSYSKIFSEAHIVVQLDMLQDVIADLTDKYAALLTPPPSEQKTLKEEHMTQVLIRPHAEDCEMIEIYSMRATSTADKQFILWGTVHLDMLDYLGFDWVTDEIADFSLALGKKL